MKKRTGPIELVHITSADRILSIQKEGIFASEYGDLSVNNDGAGVYAIRNDDEMIQKVVQNHFFLEKEALYGICFQHVGEYYECVDEIFDEEDYEEYGEPMHKGNIVIPGENVVIKPERFISIFLI